MDATALQIWCDKLGLREDMPKKACNKYRKTKTPYMVILNSIAMAELFVKKMQKLHKKYYLKYIIKESEPCQKPSPSPYDLSAPRTKPH
jgi:hypothetical protein